MFPAAQAKEPSEEDEGLAIILPIKQGGGGCRGNSPELSSDELVIHYY